MFAANTVLTLVGELTVEAKAKAEMDRIRKARNVAENGEDLAREAPRRSPKLRKRFQREKI